MKVIFYCAYYEPEIAAGISLSKDLVIGLAEAGIEVDVFTPKPTRGVSRETIKKYKKKSKEYLYDGKISIHRIPMIQEKKNPLLRAIRYFMLNVAFCWKGIVSNADVIFIDSTPPTQGLMASVVKKIKKIPIVYNLQDVFPDSMVTAGFTQQNSIIWKIGRVIENITYKNVDHIITISNSMKENVLKKGVKEEKVSTICNWIDIDKVYPIDKDKNKIYEEFSIPRDKFLVLYAGNFGAAQGADIILKVAQIMQEYKEICFVVFGGGAEFYDFEIQSSAYKNIIVNKLLPIERVSEVYSLGDIALITCKKGVGKAGMPSKTWSIMACNTPIVAAFDTGSELDLIVSAANAGICIEPENPDKLKETILEFYENKNRNTSIGRDYVFKHASKDVCVEKYIEILERKVKGKREKNNLKL